MIELKSEKYIKAIPIPVIVVNQNATALIINAEFKNLFSSYQKNFRYGETIEFIFNQEKELLKFFNEVINNQKKRTQLNWEFQEIKFLVSITKVVDQEINTYIGTFVQISQQRELNELSKKFIGNVAHELKTPLAAISCISESLVYQQGFSIEEYIEGLNVIFLEIKRLSKIVADLLDISKFDENIITLVKTEIEVQDLFDDLTHLFNERFAKFKIKLIIKPSKLTVYADYFKLKQVFINLIENALLYAKTDVVIYANLKNDNIRFIVQDNGPGLTYQQKEKIFERFYRIDESRNRNSGGTGLGLSIVKEIITGHNGEIYVQSEINQGTEFIFSIPQKRS